MATISDFMRRFTRHMEADKLSDRSDLQLVQQALARENDAAFEAIVDRHGGMVYRVCWRVLQQTQDAEDAFQATFLILAQKLRSVRKQTSLASWLHAVAHRVALRAKTQSTARRQREARAASSASSDDLTWSELRSALDTELCALPEKLRLPLILCYLEGRTQDEAAGQLRWSKSTLRRRLDEARDLLGRRLTARNVAWSAALSAALVSDCIASASPAPTLVASTVEAAAGVVATAMTTAAASAKVAALTEGVLKAMMMSKLKAIVAVVAVLGLFVTGATVLTYRTVAAQNATPAPPIAAERADNIEGIWEIVSAVYDGNPSTLAGKRTWTITKTHIEYDDTRKDAYVLDSKAIPQQINFTQIRPGDEHQDGGKFIGIYEIKGETLKICIGYGDTRPKLFESTAGSRQNLHILKRAKAPAKQEQEKEQEAFTAWGKEIGGLQAGLGFPSGQKRAYRQGETVKVVLRVRNVGKEAVDFKHIWAFFIENPPKITDADGKMVQLPNYSTSDQRLHMPRSSNVAPGKEIELYEWIFALQPHGENSSRSFIHGTGKHSLQCERIVGPTRLNPDHPNPTLSKLATGKLELEIKSDPPPTSETKSPQKPEKKDEKEAFIAWGKEVGGLQAGLTYHPSTEWAIVAHKRPYRHGETVKLVVRVRNVGKEEVTFQYVSQFLIEVPPAVTDGKGKRVPAGMRSIFGVHLPKQVNLAPGKEIELYGELEVRPDFGTGKVSVQYERVFGNSSSGQIKLDPNLSKLATGKLELEIESDPPPPPPNRDREDAAMKPIKIRVYIEKVNVDVATITASCMLIGQIDAVTKPLRFENLRVSEKAKITDRGKELKLTDLQLLPRDTHFYLFLKAYEQEFGFEVVGIETIRN